MLKSLMTGPPLIRWSSSATSVWGDWFDTDYFLLSSYPLLVCPRRDAPQPSTISDLTLLSGLTFAAQSREMRVVRAFMRPLPKGLYRRSPRDTILPQRFSPKSLCALYSP